MIAIEAIVRYMHVNVRIWLKSTGGRNLATQLMCCLHVHVHERKKSWNWRPGKASLEEACSGAAEVFFLIWWMLTARGSNISMPFSLLEYSAPVELHVVEVSTISHKNEYKFITKWHKNACSLHFLFFTVKSSIVHLLSSFSSQPSTVTQEVTQLKQPSIVRIFPKDNTFVHSLKQNYSLCWASSNDQSAMCYYAWWHFSWACIQPHNDGIIITVGAWAGITIQKCCYNISQG